MRGEKPAATRAAGKPYYDYSQPVTGEANTAVPAAPNHILEIFNIAPSVKPEEPGDAFAELKVRVPQCCITQESDVLMGCAERRCFDEDTGRWRSSGRVPELCGGEGGPGAHQERIV